MGGYIFKFIFIFLIIVFIVPIQLVQAETVPATICNGVEIITAESTVVINEIQTNGIGSGTTDQEFVELKNTGQEVVDISGWKLRYITSSGNYIVPSQTSQTPQYFVTFPGGTFLQAGGFILAAPVTYTDLTSTPKFTYAASYNLAATGGSVALVNATGIAVDVVGWGSVATTCRETTLVPAPAGGSSIQRKMIDGETIDTTNNLADFEALTTPTPQTNNLAPVLDPSPDEDVATDPTESQPDEVAPSEDTITPPTDETTTTPQQDEATPAPTENTVVVPIEQPIKINELFIDPESPQTDANDEWVELYNPGTTDQNLGGYTVYAGDTYAYHHTFAAGVMIAANGYISITSKDTSIALANGGGKVKITGPTGTMYDEVTYATAKSGEAWAKDDSGIWVWTTTPSQNSVNIITQPVAVAVIAKASTTAKKTTAKAAATATKTTTPKTATTKVKGASTGQEEQPKLVSAPTPLPIWLLALLGVLAVLYSGYEYRFDIANKIYQLRQHRTNRRANR